MGVGGANLGAVQKGEEQGWVEECDLGAVSVGVLVGGSREGRCDYMSR